MTEHAILTLRRARPEDIPRLAELLTDLYHWELPNTLHGPIEGQRQLVRLLIEESGVQGLRNRFVVVDDHDRPLATGALRLPNEPIGRPVPTSIIPDAIRLVGVGATLRMARALLRSIFTTESPQPPDTLFIHSVVVDTASRGHGIGQTLLLALEEEGRRLDLERVQLRVIFGNDSARRLYERLGYRTIHRTPAWRAPLAFATELMEKPL